MLEYLSSSHLEDLFELSTTEPNTLAQSESEVLEFKRSFSKFSDPILKTCAAFANNRGGYIVFGIVNDSRELVGLDDEHLRLFDQYDLAEATKKLNARFNPSISIRKRTFSKSGLQFGIVYVYESESKPVIATNGTRDIRDGDIFYRYGGRNDRIKYYDLNKMLDRKLDQQLQQLFKHLNILAQFGIHESAIMNTQTGDVIGPATGRFVISEDLVNSLKFIKEGEFNELTGAPTLKLVGTLQTETGEEVVTKPTYISRSDIYHGFLYQHTIPNPKEYLRAITEQTTEYTPIYHYALQARMNRDELISYISGLGTKESYVKSRLLERIADDSKLGETLRNTGTTAYEKRLMYWEKISCRSAFEILDEDVRYILFAIQTIEKPELHSDYIMELLQKLFARFTRSAEIDGTSLRKTICYIDHLLNPLR